MRKVVTNFSVLIVCCLYSLILNGQNIFEKSNVYEFAHNSFFYKMNFKQHSYELYKSNNVEDVKLSFGSFIHSTDSLILIDYKTKHKSIFKVTNKFRLRVLKGNKYLKKQEFLLLTQISNSNKEMIEHMTWKNGKPHGLWLKVKPNGFETTRYKNGKIKSAKFESYEEMHSKQTVD
jgi:hypothetical protein